LGAAARLGTRAVKVIVSYLHDDTLGSVESITAADGSIVGGRHFDAFGDSQGIIAAVGQEPYGYTGQEQDPELGLVNMHGRMYDPRLGQFLSPDPEIQSPYGQGLNRFAYVFNSPLNLTDPSGFTATESYWEAGLGLGVPYTAGLVATIWQSSAGGEAAFEAGENAVQAAVDAAPSVADAATTAIDTAEAVGVGGHVVASLVHTVISASNQGTTHLETKAPSTRAAPSRSVAHGNFKNSAVSARSEPAPAPAPVATKSEPACNAECMNASPAGLAPPVNHVILNQAAPLVDDSGEMFDESMGVVFQAATVVFGPAELVGLGVRAAEGAGVAGKITGFTKHGLNQAISRDGVGVSSRAILDAVKNPQSIVSQGKGVVKYIGEHATVILNDTGKVITTWAHDVSAWRIVP